MDLNMAQYQYWGMILYIVQYQYWVTDLDMAYCQHEELELEHGSAFPLKELLAWNTTPYFNFLKKEIMYPGWMEHILSEIELSVKWHRCPVDTGISMNTYVTSGKRQWRNANTGRSTYLEECPAWDRGVS